MIKRFYVMCSISYLKKKLETFCSTIFCDEYFKLFFVFFSVPPGSKYQRFLCWHNCIFSRLIINSIKQNYQWRFTTYYFKLALIFWNTPAMLIFNFYHLSNITNSLVHQLCTIYNNTAIHFTLKIPRFI